MPLTYDPAGLPAEVQQRFPHLAGYLALRLDRATARTAGDCSPGSWPSASTTASDACATPPACRCRGCSTPSTRRRPSASSASPGSAARRRCALWAPTAKDVDLLVWKAGEHGAATGPGQRDADGVWTARGTSSWRGAQYLFEVTVCAPSTRRWRRTRSPTRTRSRSHELDPFGGRRPRRPGAGAASSGAPRRRPSWRGRSTPRSTSCTCATSRSVTRPSRPSTAAPTSPSPTRAPAASTCATLADAGLNTVHLLPTFDITSIEEVRADAGGAGVRPGVVRAGLDRAAGLRHGRGRRRRLQLGLRPVPLDGAGGLVRDGARGWGARGGVPHHGGCAARRRPAGRGGRGLQPHLGLGPGATPRCSTRSCRATTTG